MPAVLKFIAITTFTGVVCYLIYEFILRRIVFLRPLFGLKWKFNETRTSKILTKPISKI